MGVINYKCKTCGGQLNYDIESKKLLCSSCRTSYDISEYEQKGIKDGNLEVLVCNNCGAKVVGNETVFSTTCIYCRSNLIVKIKGTSTTSNRDNTSFESRPFSRSCELKIERVPADAKINLDNTFLQGIEPFNYEELKEFDYPYLLGKVAEYYDEDKEAIVHSQIKDRVIDAAYTKLSRTIPVGSVAIHSRQTYMGKEKF